MKVFVVMGNDFPDGVFETQESAETYCRLQREKDEKEKSLRRIYWRVYPFELKKD